MKSFDKSISTLRIAMARVGDIINNIDNDDYDWMTRHILMYHKNVFYQTIDLLLKEKRKRDNLNPLYSSDKNASKKYLSEILRRGKSSFRSSLSIAKSSSGLTKLIINPKCYLRFKISPYICVIKRSDF